MSVYLFGSVNVFLCLCISLCISARVCFSVLGLGTFLMYTDVDFRALIDLCVKRSRGLKQLWLDGAEISDVGVQSIVDLCCDLSLLSFSFAELLTDVSLQYIKVCRLAFNLLHTNYKYLYTEEHTENI